MLACNSSSFVLAICDYIKSQEDQGLKMISIYTCLKSSYNIYFKSYLFKEKKVRFEVLVLEHGIYGLCRDLILDDLYITTSLQDSRYSRIDKIVLSSPHESQINVASFQNANIN